MAAGAVDQDEIAVRLKARHRSTQAMIEHVFARLQFRLIGLGQFVIGGRGQVQPSLGQIFSPVGNIAAKGFLPQVKVERANLVPHPCKGRCDMHRHRRFAGATFFVPHDNNMRHAACPLDVVLGHHYMLCGRQGKDTTTIC